MYQATNKNLKLIIEYDDSVGYYLYVYSLDSNKSLADHLLDELEDAFDEAEESYGIARNQWKTMTKVEFLECINNM